MTATDTTTPAAGPLPAGDRYILISADCHAGGEPRDLPRRTSRSVTSTTSTRGAAQYANPFRDLQGDGRSRNWDDERRIREQEEDGGVVAEVVFPNTVPPFFPTAMHIARPPMPDEYEHRLAGIRAHNRWLADWCAEHPERRAGIGQIFLNDLDDAIADVHWIKEHGLRGGILLPSVPPDVTHIIDPLYSTLVRQALGGLPGPRRRRQPALRHRHARLRPRAGRRRDLAHRDGVLLAAARSRTCSRAARSTASRICGSC